MPADTPRRIAVRKHKHVNRRDFLRRVGWGGVGVHGYQLREA